MLGYASGGWIAAALGWRLAFGVIGVAGLALAPLVLLLVREPARTGSGLSARTEKAPPLGEAMRFLWRRRTHRSMLIGTTLQHRKSVVVGKTGAGVGDHGGRRL